MAPDETGARDDEIDAALGHIAAGRLTDAAAICRAVVTADPDHGQAWHLLGGIALQRGDAAAAIDHCRRAIAAAPNLAKAHSNLGAALLATGQVADAIAALQTALRVDPGLAAAYLNLGDALLKANRIDEAVGAFARAVELQPGHALARASLGGALTRQRRLDEAIAVLNEAVALDPTSAAAHNNLGNALRWRGDYEGALVALHRALELAPEMAEIHAHLGFVCRVMGRLDDADAWFTRVLESPAGYPDGAYYRSAVRLAQGRFAEGWRDYLARPSVRNQAARLNREPLGEDLTGRRILLLRDQGLGDEIFFLRFAPELKRRGAHLVYRANGKIVPLLRSLAVFDRVIGEDTAAPPADLAISIGDLPFLLALPPPYDVPPTLRLPVEPTRLAAQQAALAALGPPPYIGLTWRAGADELGSLFKSAPLDRIGAVLRRASGTLIALQRLPEADEIGRLAGAAGRAVHDFTALNDRLDDMLALLALLDDYVAVSNTNVHLRAAVGGGGRILVPNPAEFRWLAAGPVSPWFPDCRVYRQDIGGGWDGALAALGDDFAARAAG